MVATEHEGDIVGVSWLAPPYRWRFDARARELVARSASMRKCLRDKCEADNHLGYEMMKRFLPLVVGRLERRAMQLLDVYGTARQRVSQAAELDPFVPLAYRVAPRAARTG